MNDYYMQIYLFIAGDALINHWHHLKESDPPVHHLKEPVKSYPCVHVLYLYMRIVPADTH